MKRTALDHPKIRHLGRLLEVPLYAAVGVLECMWHFTARHAIRGDIGKWRNDVIAEAIGWPIEKATQLIDALVEAKLLERHSRYRLVVHDWHDHADESTRKTLGKHKLPFASRDPSAPDADQTGVFPGKSDSVPESIATVPEPFSNGSEKFSSAGAGAGAGAGAVARAGASSRRKKPGTAGAYRSVTEEMLRDSTSLLSWNDARLGAPAGDRDRLFVVAAAERALEVTRKDGGNPAALFVRILKDDSRDLITAAQEDRARERLRAYRSNARPSSLSEDLAKEMTKKGAA